MLCITFDNFGSVATLPPCPFPDIVPVAEWNRMNELGLELGHPRILTLLDQLGISTTFFAEGYAAVLHPAEMRRWVDAGHEIGLHGWKHEMWANVPSREDEDHLLGLAVAAVKEVTGEPPRGFRPPGLKINPWSDEVFKAHGITYVAQALERDERQNDRLANIGITYANETPFVVSSLPIVVCSDRLLDADLISPKFGGLYGALDADEAYERYFELALAHQSRSPDEPWTFIVHPFLSGNRSWFAFEHFLRRLVGEFGRDAFKLARDVARPISAKALQ